MEKVIKDLYTAFQQLDAKTMASCYHDDAEFWDPGFGKLKGKEITAMWTMLCQSAQDFKLEYSNITPNTAHWEAWYVFSKTGRKVHNKIDATFEFKDGKIIKHTDQFDLKRWAKQAIGWQGWLLGGTSFFQNKLHQQTGKMLHRFMKKNNIQQNE